MKKKMKRKIIVVRLLWPTSTVQRSNELDVSLKKITISQDEYLSF